MTDANDISPRVNSAMLGNFTGRTVRLTCRMIKPCNDGKTVIVEASDGGQVEIKLNEMSETYVDIIGKVMDERTIQMLGCINLGEELDMKLVNDTIELIHDPRFYKKMFTNEQ